MATWSGSFIQLFGFATLFIFVSTKPTTTVVQNIPRVVNANNILSFNLYKSFVNDENNIFFSPLSISTALAMLHMGAGGKTAQEMEVALGYREADVDVDNIHPTFKELLSDLATPKDEYTLTLANAMLARPDSGILSSYKQNLHEFYNAFFKEIDFGQPENVKLEVNSWAKEATRGKIPELLKEPPSSNTLLVLLNAVYFKGNWETPFNPEYTMSRPFFQNGDSNTMKNVPMMLNDSAVLPYVYIQHVGVKAVELPYDGNDLSMIIVLPDKMDGVKELEERLTSRDFNSILYGLKKTKIDLLLPKFKIEYSRQLEESLIAMGMKSAFDSTADLSRINGNTNLYVSSVLHKAVIEVNEQGSEAAAVTELEISFKMGIDSPSFLANHPFLFYIIDKNTNMILFVGKVNKL